MSNVLVVYYSRTGTTRRVAEELASLAGWDLEPVLDTRAREGVVGYLRSAFDSLLGRRTELAASRHNFADYDLVVVGSPVWNGSVSAPIRTWLEDRRGLFPALAFFATEGGRGAPHAFRQMASLASRAPIATLELTGAEVARGPLAPRVAPLVAAVESAVGGPQPHAASPEATPPASH